MRVIGLTGGIGMGKSTAARAFRLARIPVFDADAVVHSLQAKGGAALPAISTEFPGSVVGGVLNRQVLRDAVLGKPDALKKLERILHPLVRRAEQRFLAQSRIARAPAAVLDIPLLFETGGERRVDQTIVVSAPKSVQMARVKRRRKMDAAQIEAVIARQMPDAEKRRRADIVINTGLSRFHALRQVKRILQDIRA
jgi:dephospho-CoA kinase